MGSEMCIRDRIEVDDVRRSRLQHDLELVVLVEAVRIFTIAGVLRTTRGLNVGGTPGFRPQSPQKGRSMGRAGTDFQVDRLQQSTALAVPIFLLSLIHISEPTRRTPISYAVFCLKKKKNTKKKKMMLQKEKLKNNIS